MMISLVRKNHRHSISDHNFLACKSSISLFLALHFSSTSRATTPPVYDVLVHKHQFSPQVASLVASNLSRFRSPEKADSTLSFLKENGFSPTQVEKMAKNEPRILTASLAEDIKFKIEILKNIGLSSEAIAKIVSSNQWILNLSAKNNIIPSLSLLKNVLGPNRDVATLLRKCAWFLASDLNKTLVPNVEFLKGCGLPMERILKLLDNSPRCLLTKPDMIRKSIDKAKEMGVSQSSKMLIYAVRVLSSANKETWELKLQSFRDLGFSDSDILIIFRKAPNAFTLSVEKTRSVKELLLATGKFNISSIVSNPTIFGYSIENRLKPRLKILGILESRYLIKKWPSLADISKLTDDKFVEKFIDPYSNELGEVCASRVESRAKN